MKSIRLSNNNINCYKRTGTCQFPVWFPVLSNQDYLWRSNQYSMYCLKGLIALII